MERRQTVWTGLTAAGIFITVIFLSNPVLYGESGGNNYYSSAPVQSISAQSISAQSAPAQAAGASSGTFARVPSGTLLPKNPALYQAVPDQPASSQPVPYQPAAPRPQENTADNGGWDNGAAAVPETPFVSAYAGEPVSSSVPAANQTITNQTAVNPAANQAVINQTVPNPAVFTAQNQQQIPEQTPQSAPAVQSAPQPEASAQSAPAAVQPASQITSQTTSQPTSQAAPVQPAQNANSPAPSSGILTEESSAAPANGILPPPENFSMTAEDEKMLDQFLLRWEEFGRHIKRVACEVQIKEHDGGLFMQNSKGGKIPLSHTWGKFKFIAPNKLSYHVEGEYAYQPGTSSDDEPKMEFKKGSGELKYVCDGKSWAEYDFKNRVVHIYSIPEDQWNQDLSMDGPIPLFFIANAKNLKNRFYLNIVTPKGRTSSEVWIEAYPRQVADSGSFQRIIIILSLTDLQPTYMRKYYVNGKSYSELWFQNVAVNKGMWDIEADVDFGWEKKVMDETFAITPIEPALPHNGVKATSGTLPPEEQK